MISFGGDEMMRMGLVLDSMQTNIPFANPKPPISL
jgi:hypothetical protein